MISAALVWLLPDNLWSWIAVIALGLLVAAAWLVPGIKLAWRIVATAALIAVAVITAQHSLWQAEVEAHADTKTDLTAAKTALAAERKQRVVLEREALQKVRDDAAIDAATTELKDKIDEAAKQVPPGAVTDPAARAVSCRRLQRSGQTASGEYKRLCG